MTNEERCEKHEMILAFCGECNGKAKEFDESVKTPTRRMAARFPGKCVGCEEPFGVGETIESSGGYGWLGPCCWWETSYG